MAGKISAQVKRRNVIDGWGRKIEDAYGRLRIAREIRLGEDVEYRRIFGGYVMPADTTPKNTRTGNLENLGGDQ